MKVHGLKGARLGVGSKENKNELNKDISMGSQFIGLKADFEDKFQCSFCLIWRSCPRKRDLLP